MSVRLNKFISESGFCSRREADRMVESGKVTINGKVAEIGRRVSARDVVKVNGNVIENNNETVYIALNKPVGIVCTTDSSERGNVVDFVNYPTRIFNIGRLDKDSEGLILLTNDGDIVNKILRAANNHEKEYEVSVDKPITEEFVRKMASGVPILGTTTKRCKVTQEDVYRFRVILTQGLNRQIRRMCEALGYDVVKLRRVRVMNIGLDRLPVGDWRMLTDDEMQVLTASIEGSDGGEEASKNAGAGKSVAKGKSRSAGGSKGKSAGASKGKSAGASRGKPARSSRPGGAGRSSSGSSRSSRPNKSPKRGARR